jgi:hypothetical protein
MMHVIERIIDKNLKIGMDSGINKVPKLIEENHIKVLNHFLRKAMKLFEKVSCYVASKGRWYM